MTIVARSQHPFFSTLPGRYYYDPDIYQQELEHIFSAMWVCVGRTENLPEAGMYRLVTVGAESVIVVRGQNGELLAFLNVCRHRGAQICTATSGQVKGSFQCRYHAWTYGLDGSLLGAPNILNTETFDRSTYGLQAVALATWEGLIWLNLSAQPGQLQAQIQSPLLARFGSLEPFQRYHMGALTVGKSLAYTVHANWKIVMENFLECYHCGPMHPEFCALLPAFKTGQTYIGDEAASLAEGVDAFSQSGRASRPPLPHLTAAEMRSYYGISLWPNVLLNFVPDHVIMHTISPTGPTSCQVVCDWLFDADERAKVDFDPSDAVEIFDLVNRQDWEVCELTQAGMPSRAFASGGLYVPAEAHIHEFVDFILERLP